MFGLLVVAAAMPANAADGGGGLDGPTGQDQSPGESDDDELDQCQMQSLCVSGCEGSRQMAYWDCHYAYEACKADLALCLGNAKKHPGSNHCMARPTNMLCDQDYFLCEMAAEGNYNACVATCEAEYPCCS
jgi:hypothetical protein